MKYKVKEGMKMTENKTFVIRRMTEQQKEWFKSLRDSKQEFYTQEEIHVGLGIVKRTLQDMITKYDVNEVSVREFDPNSRLPASVKLSPSSYAVGQINRLQNHWKNKAVKAHIEELKKKGEF